MTYQLQYVINGSTISETYYFPNMALCNWKINQLMAQGSHKYGVFNIIKI